MHASTIHASDPNETDATDAGAIGSLDLGLNASFASVGRAQDETAPSAPATEAPSAAAAKSDALPVHGSFYTRFVARSGGGDHDSDLYELLSLDVRDPQHDPWSVHVLAGATLDVDGRSKPSSPFYSLEDTLDDPFTSVLYEASVSSRSVPGLALVRLGRQIDYSLPEIITYDGIDVQSVENGPNAIAVGAYGGALARIYTPQESGNTVFGAFVEGRPWSDSHVRLDWMHLEDDTLLGAHKDDLVSLTANQGLGAEWRLDESYTRLENDSRDASVRATYASVESDLLVQASWYRLFQPQSDLPLETDPFSAILLEQSPYTEGRFVASKSFGPRVHVEAGADVRRVSSSEDVAEFNRDYERWYATTTLTDVLPAGIELAVTGEVWDSDGDDISSWGLDLTRHMSEKLSASIGTYYSLYKYDLFLVSEHDDVRTYYLRLKYRSKGPWTWDLRYEHEDSVDEFDTLRAGVTWSF